MHHWPWKQCVGWGLALLLIVGFPTTVPSNPPVARAGGRLSPAAEAPSPEFLLHRETAVLHTADPEVDDEFGYTVAISGDTVAVGAPFDDTQAGDAGAVYVFQRGQGITETWELVTTLYVTQAGAWFGFSLAMQGDTIVVGADYYDVLAAVDAGAAFVFERDLGGPNAWGWAATLTASDYAAYDHFGRSVSIDGDTIVAGAIHADCGGCAQEENSGAAYIFQRDWGGPDHWGQVDVLHASDAQTNDRFGLSVGISGDTIVSGAYLEDGGSGDPVADAGAAYIYELLRPNVFLPLITWDSD